MNTSELQLVRAFTRNGKVFLRLPSPSLLEVRTERAGPGITAIRVGGGIGADRLPVHVMPDALPLRGGPEARRCFDAGLVEWAPDHPPA